MNDAGGLQWSAGVCMRSTFCCTLHLCSCTIQHPTEDKAASFMCKPSLDSLIKKTQWLIGSYCSWVMMRPSISVHTTHTHLYDAPLCMFVACNGLTQQGYSQYSPPSSTFSPFSGLDQSVRGKHRRWRAHSRKMVRNKHDVSISCIFHEWTNCS